MPGVARRRPRARRSPRSRAARRANAIATPTPSPPTGASAVRVLHARDRHADEGPARQEGRRRSTRDDAARHLGAHLCRCTGYVKILDAIESCSRDGERRRRATCAGRRRHAAACEYEARRARARRPRLHRRHAVPGMLHGALAPRRPRPGRGRAHRHGRARPCPASRRCSPPPTSPASCGSASSTPTGRSSSPKAAARPTSATCSRSWSPTTATPHGARRGRSSTSPTTCCARSPIRSRPSTIPRSPCGARRRTCSRVRSTPRRRRRRRARRVGAHVVHETFQTQRIEHAFLEPESTLAVPRRTAARCTSTPAARACGTTATRSRRCSARTRRVMVELVSNGGAFGGKEDMANQAQTALAAWLLQRPVKCTLSPRGEPADAPEAPPDPHGVPGRAATPTAASPRCGPAWSATPASYAVGRA